MNSIKLLKDRLEAVPTLSEAEVKAIRIILECMIEVPEDQYDRDEKAEDLKIVRKRISKLRLFN